MFTKQVDAALTLIALSIFADKRILSTEISAFIESADVIQANLNSDIPITEAKLLVWFEMNRGNIKEKMEISGKRFRTWLDQLLDEVDTLPDKRFIVELIESIARSDGEYHVSEVALAVIIDRKFKA